MNVLSGLLSQYTPLLYHGIVQLTIIFRKNLKGQFYFVINQSWLLVPFLVLKLTTHFHILLNRHWTDCTPLVLLLYYLIPSAPRWIIPVTPSSLWITPSPKILLCTASPTRVIKILVIMTMIPIIFIIIPIPIIRFLIF